MKVRFHTVFLLALLVPCSLDAQQGSFTEHVEIFVNVNRSAFFNDNTENEFGMGAGLAYVFQPDRNASFVSGVEYTQTRHFQYQGKQYDMDAFNDLELEVNLLSVPLGYRMAFGEKQNFYAEGGAYIDVPLMSSVDYRYTKCRPDETGTLICNTTYHTDTRVAQPCMGLYLGLAYRMQVGGVSLAIKPDFKLGFRTIFEGNEEYGFGRYYRLHLVIGLG